MPLEFRQFLVFGSTFEVTKQYVSLEPIGIGTSGIVCSSKDEYTGRSVAIKKVSKPFLSLSTAKQTYREIKILQYLRHDNVISLTDSFISPNEDVYFVTELLGTDLQSLLGSGPLEKKYCQYFSYQIMRALKYVHSAGVIHRDLKPGNILINENCELKICDFGLARIIEKKMTEYVSTRHYRAPEVVLSENSYGQNVDIWSAGCILAEMLTGKVIFFSTNYMNHIAMIIDLLGSPSDDYVDYICSKSTSHIVKNIPKKEKKDFASVFTNCTPEEIQVIERMLTLDVRVRATAKEVLELDYFSDLHDENDEPVSEAKFDWSFIDNDYDLPTLKELIHKEVREFKKRD